MNSSELKGYLTGLILGDGFIGSGITKRSFSIKSIHYDFIERIKSDLESCTNFKISIKFTPEHYSCGCNHKDSWELNIKSHPYFCKKYHHFYNDYKKRIASKDALNWLNDVGLANWYMSDGYVCLVGKESNNIYNRRIDMCTDRYDLETIYRMMKMLKEKFNLETSLVKRGKFYRIRIKQKSYSNFINIISPYIVDSMKYKLYLGYQFQPKWMDNDMWEFQESLSSATTQTGKAVG